jgi:hypothetical protein
LAKKARVYDGTAWQELASAQTDLTAYSTTAQTTAGFRNAIINGDFRINQRAFTSTTTNNAYGFDRWQLVTNNGTCTYSSQAFTVGNAISGYEPINHARMVTSGQTLAGAYSLLIQKIEDVRTFAGQTVTISFWAKAASGTPKVVVETEQYFGTGGSPSAGVTAYAGQATLSTSWNRYSITATVPSISGKTIGTTANTSFIELNLWTSAGTDFNARTNSLGIQSTTIDFWGVQVELGSVATPFEQRPIGTELSLCQRYYEKSYDLGTALGTSTIVGAFFSGSSAPTTGYIVTSVPYKVSKRKSNPTLSIWDTMAGTSGRVTRETYGSSQQSVTGSLDASGENSFRALSSSGANANGISFHWASDAEL